MNDKNREEILAIFPSAAWMPWDDSPIGQKVRIPRPKSQDFTGVVLGLFHALETTAGHCATCRCPEAANYTDGPWQVQVDGWHDSGTRHEKTDTPRPGAKPMVMLCYPPDLQPLDEDASYEAHQGAGTQP